MTTDAPTAALQQLLDIEEIKRLKARYFRTLDRKEWAEWGEVLAIDVVMELPEADACVTGRDEVVVLVSGALAGAQTCHHGHMPEIELTGADSATGVWAMCDYVEWPVGEDGTRNGLMGYGHYEEEYVREDGAWRIGRLRLVRLRVDSLAGS